MSRKRGLAKLAFALALLLTLVLGARTVHKAIYWSDPAHRDARIETWMTPGYVMRSYDLPSEVLRAIVQIPQADWRRHTIAEIAAQRDMPVGDLIGDIYLAIDLHRRSAE